MKILHTVDGAETVVDDDIYEWAVKINWRLNGNGYVSYRKGNGRIYLHRLIVNCPDNFITDHINGNKLDNLKSNLRISTRHQNLFNSNIRSDNVSGYRGVYFRKDRGKWASEIKCNGKKYALGCYENIQDAAKAYNTMAKKLFGEHARLNSIKH